MIDDPDDVDEGRWGDDQIDLVAEPVRYPRSPLLLLLLIAILPAVGLFVLRQWADDEADLYEETNRVGIFETELVGSYSPEPAPTGPDGELPAGEDADADADEDSDDDGDNERIGDAITTRLFDFRRSPDLVANAASTDRLRAALEPVLGSIDDQSCVTVAVDGIVVAETNPLLPVIPASTQKVLVAVAALDILGPDHRFTTSVAIPPLQDGVVDGDVFLIGGGDPLLTSGDFLPDDGSVPFATTSFDALADAVVEAGVTRIRGTVIGDGTRYDDEFFVAEWAEDVPFLEAGPYDALLANDSRVFGRSGVEVEPNEAAAREFVRLLNARGIQVDNGWGSGAASNLVPVAASVESAPLVDVLREMLVTSDNNTAEMLVKEIGAVSSGQGTRAAGLGAIQARLEASGITMEGLRLRDGSGLSVENRVTCRALTEVLHLAADGPIIDSLPVAGRSGTLLDEFDGSPVVGRLTAKTGTLGNPPLGVDPPGVKALAGFVPPDADSGAGTIEFSIIANQELITDETIYQPLWAAFAERFAGYPSGPDADSLGPR